MGYKLQRVLAAIFLLCIQTATSDKLMIIMLDGFRWDYIDRLTEEQIPNFSQFVSDGVRAEYVQPAFPSVSWPGWTTISTGKQKPQ